MRLKGREEVNHTRQTKFLESFIVPPNHNYFTASI